MNLEDLRNDVLVFDFDGVLIHYDFPALNRKCFNANEWINENLHKNPYDSVRRMTFFDKLIKEKKPEELFLLSTALSSAEEKNKVSYLKKYYPNIPVDQAYFVSEDKYKKDVMLALRDAVTKVYGAAKRLCLIEDSPSIMMDIEGARRPNMKCFLVSDFMP